MNYFLKLLSSLPAELRVVALPRAGVATAGLGGAGLQAGPGKFGRFIPRAPGEGHPSRRGV